MHQRLTALFAGLLVLALTGACTAQEPEKPKTIDLNDFNAKASYAIGMKMGSDFQKQGFAIDPDALAKGMKDIQAGGKTLLTEDEVMATLKDLQAKMREEREALAKKESMENLEAGRKFMEENKAKEGVVVLPSGLQYQVLESGNGKSPSAGEKVSVHYRGTLLDGTEFDSSYARGEPVTLDLNRVIKGWQEALPMMKEGDKWKLFIPSDLAYGERGAGAKIGPNSTLIFEVELVKVNPEPKEK